jgi:hypothetical protein
MKRDVWNKCDVCGRFIGLKDLENKKAIVRMITPHTDLSYESWEKLCKKHAPQHPERMEER